jgi:hypothetical protein
MVAKLSQYSEKGLLLWKNTEMSQILELNLHGIVEMSESSSLYTSTVGI